MIVVPATRMMVAVVVVASRILEELQQPAGRAGAPDPSSGRMCT